MPLSQTVPSGIEQFAATDGVSSQVPYVAPVAWLHVPPQHCELSVQTSPFCKQKDDALQTPP